MGIAEEEIADDGCPNQQGHLEALVVLDFNAVQVVFHDGHLLEAREQGHGDVGLLALLGLLAGGVCRLARHVAGHVLAQPTLLPPRKVDARGIGVGAGVALGAVEVRVAGHAERDLGDAELPAHCAAPFGRLLADNDLRVGVVELDGELGGEDGLRRGRHAAISAYLLLREGGMGPAGLREDLAVENLGVVAVEQGYGVRVLRIVGGRVDVVQRVLGIGLGAVLGEVEGFVVLDLVRRGLEEEGCRRLSVCGRYCNATGELHVLGRFSSNIASCREGESWTVCKRSEKRERAFCYISSSGPYACRGAMQ